MRTCASCGAENVADARFCGDCGEALGDLRCPHCGASQPGRRYCVRCGGTLTEPDLPREDLEPRQARAPGLGVSERRVCSVLFADLVGFTPLAEARDPEEVREILSRYFGVCRDLIHRYGGIVEKFIGDAVMAVWGTPVADEGDSERAVRAALDLVAAVEVLGAEVGAPGLSARAGVVTGEVAVTVGATGEGMVAGDAVNTASRVQASAAAGSVLVDDATRRLSERAIAFDHAGTFDLKGKAQAEELFRATRVVSGVGGKQRADGLEAPFTGRDAELRALKDLFHTTVERRTPRLAVVAGPAGVGKSRLGWEFEKYVDGIADTVLWHRGRCLSYGEGVAFWGLAEIVRQRFGIAEEDSTETAAAKLEEGMVRFVDDGAEREYVGVRLSRLLGVPYPSETKVVLSKEELYAGWRLFFERLAQVAPVVMLVEDAQHADESLLGFFEHLIDWTRDLPIFVLLFARPGLEAIDSGFGIGRNRSTLSLDPLDDASMATLVASLVPGMPSQARDAITARAEGIALFAVETVRSLIDQGIVRRDGDGYRLAGQLGQLSVPNSLHSLLAARLDALPPEVRTLVADASVLGSSFPKEALVAVSGREEPAVLDGLAELVRRDVLQVFADPLSPERGAYRFSQEMLRQVAYETLSKRDRKARHLAVAGHLRGAFANDGEEIADAIARHYLDALAGGPNDPDAEQVASEALAFLVRSAERAERSGAPARASENFAEAAAIAPADRAAALFERASQASFDLGDYETAVAYADEARGRHLALGDGRGAARARSMKANALHKLGRHGTARSELLEALEVLRPDPDEDTVTALDNLASLEIFSGNLVAGERLADEALRLGQALDVGVTPLAQAFSSKGVAASMANRSIEGAAHFETAARLADRAGDLGMLSLAQLNLAAALTSTDPVGAAAAARSSMGHARRMGRRNQLSSAVSNLVIALVEIGDWDEADAVVRQALDEEHLDEPPIHDMAGWLAGLRGDLEGVRHALASLGRYRESEETQAQAEVGFLEMLASLCDGDLRGALANGGRVLEHQDALGLVHETQRWAWLIGVRTARELGDHHALGSLLAMVDARPVGHVPPVLRAARQLAGALLAAEDGAPDGPSQVSRAVSLLRATGHRYELAHGLADLAGTLTRAGDDGADAALSEARDIAVRLRCGPLLSRVDGVADRADRADRARHVGRADATA